MTEEQIKQNAEEYAMSKNRKGINFPRYISFIAGAHSRDEEIEELQNELKSLRKGFYERGDKLEELMLANNNLRNPWVSVEDRLPEETGDYIVRVTQRWFVAFFSADHGRFIHMPPSVKVRYWMSVPAIQTQNKEE